MLHLAAEGRLKGLVDSVWGRWLRPVKEPTLRFADRARALSTCRRVARTVVANRDGCREMTVERDGRVLRRCGPDDIAHADAVRADYADWWFCVRPSGTEPIVRLAIEARSPGLLGERTAELIELFEGSADP
jgi:phosphomannomutase